ncbi:hypothetical protein NDU88_001269 [Pleurodeles waltl]|uniref:Uncharacterized protein n=1 Tax=Pleurodeles waltl TaxID=8319 RepID=A0AAV7MPF6_PLEWA|nr:hypothetical protein NDU88_001269 [Pleurodeles waltl]
MFWALRTFLAELLMLKLSPEECELLVPFLDKKELLNAVTSLKITKARGDDGLPAEFYKLFPESLVDKLLPVYTEALERDLLLDSMREAMIVIIPKPGRDPMEMTPYRPLSILNVDQLNNNPDSQCTDV